MEKKEPSNPCCVKWKDRCTKLKDRFAKNEDARNALRNALNMLERTAENMRTEIVSHKEALEDEKEKRARESVVRVSLENEVSALKSEVHSLKQNGNLMAQGVDQEVENLRNRVSEGETEINKLKELLDKERIRADEEKKKVDVKRKKADEAAKKVKAENSRANEEKRLADIERRKAKDFSRQLEAFKSEVNEAKSKLSLASAKLEETNNKLNAEKEKTTMERERADREMAKVEEQRKTAEANWKKAMDEKRRTDNLSQQLEKASKRVKELENEIQKARDTNTGEASRRLEKLKQKMIKEKKRAKLERKKAEEQTQVAEAYKKVSMEEKHQLDQLSHELGCYKQRWKEAQEEIQNLISSITMVECSTLSSGGETAEMKLLKKQLKFEKMRVKHVKQVARMEQNHNRVLGKEVIQLKQDLVQFLQRLDTLSDYVLQRQGNINELEKQHISGLEHEYFDEEPCQRSLSYGNIPTKPTWKCTTTGRLYPLVQGINCTASLPPISGNIYMKSSAGIDSKLQPLTRGPDSNMLRSSVINSSAASFSDGPLVVSDERGVFSVNRSANLTEEIQNRRLTPSGLSSDARKIHNEKEAVEAENSVGSPIKTTASARSGKHKKRKKIIDSVEPIEYMHSAGQNLHQQVLEKLSFLHRMLNSQMDNSVQKDGVLLANLHGNMFKKVESYKKRKSSAGQAMAIDNLHDSNELMTSPETSNIGRPNVCKETSETDGNKIRIGHAGKDGMDGLSGSNLDLPRGVFEMIEGDWTKLLALDDDLDEERYQEAFARPISPTIPMIEFPNNEAPEICNNMPSSIHTFYEDCSHPNNNSPPSCDFDVMNLEIDSNEQTINRFGSSKLLEPHKDRYTNATCENVDIFDNANSDITCNCEVSRPMCNSNFACNVSENQKNPSGSNGASMSARFPRYYIVSSNIKDSSSISRILWTSNCIGQFSKVSPPDMFLQNTLLAFQKADDLSAKEVCYLPKERACVLVSLLLCYISEFSKQNFGEMLDMETVQFIDSFAQQICSVLSNVDTRRMFTELCDMHELLYLMEDFLLNRRVLVYDHMSRESSVGCDSRFMIDGGGSCLVLSIQAVPMKLQVAGGVLLASICAATDQISFLCELSYSMFRMHKSNSLLVLHIFAHLGGSKYFNLEGYYLQMSVLKCLVVFLEKLNSSTDCIPCFPSVLDASSKGLFSFKCPFSYNVASVDVVVTVLLEKLQQHTLECQLQDPKEASAWLSVAVSKGKGTEDISGHREGAPSIAAFNENLFYFINILSLLELVAGIMNWEWTFGKIISPLLQMVESCVTENVSAAIIALLGQLGRLGVDAKGYEDSGVESLRNWLCTCVCQSTSRNFDLPIQFTSMTALLDLVVGSFEEVIETNTDIPGAVGQSNDINCIRRWISSLDAEQQSSFRLLNSSIKDELQLH